MPNGKDDICTVQPLRSEAEVLKIDKLLKKRPRDYLLWVMGTQSGLRAKDLLGLTVEQVKDKPLDYWVRLRETKTSKKQILVLNVKVQAALEKYFKAYPKRSSGPLFRSQRGGRALTSGQVGRLVRSWCEAIGLTEEQYGTHTMRKTWGYLKRTVYGVGIELLMEAYNHSSPQVTKRYLCITDDEIAALRAEPIAMGTVTLRLIKEVHANG